MRNITALVLGTLLLVGAGKVRALSPLPSCVTDKDCTTNYRCIYSGDSKNGQCKYVAATSIAVKAAILGESCGALPKGMTKCAEGLKCELTKYSVMGSNGKVVTKMGTIGKCVSNTVTPSPSPKTNCSMKKCGDSNCDGQINSLDLVLWMKERRGVGKNSDFNSDGKVDLKDYDLLRAGMINNRCKGEITLPRVTVMPTKIIEGPKTTPIVSRFCNTNNDCVKGQVCYQPPMPTCVEGSVCAQVMPNKYCKGEIVLTPTGLPVTGIPSPMYCKFTGDADGDGKATLKDYAIWKFEYSTGRISKGDFNCDKKVNLADYQIWKNIFLSTRNLKVTTNN